jgi:type IV pilus assembly protein PilO
MSRTTTILAALGVVVVLAAWYLLLWSPRVEALETVEADIVTAQQGQATAQARISELQQVREQAPALQAELAAAAALLPQETALPGALRQLQQATDDSGATLVSVSPARPTPVVATTPAEATTATDLYAVGLSLEIQGSYFQIVDTLRRLEDPAISPRGFVWETVALTVDEYPNLTVAVTGRMFSVLQAPPAAPDPAAQPPAADESSADGETADGETADGETTDDASADATS